MKRTAELLLNEIIKDVGLMCNTSIDKDLSYLRSRVESEGESFFTITLPTFAKDTERCLELGSLDPSCYRAFRKKGKQHGSIPCFLSGITSKIFDVNGSVRTDCPVEAVDGVRQICLAFHKTKKECSDERKAKAIYSFKQCEQDIGKFRVVSWGDLDLFDRVARLAFGRLFSNVECKLLGLNVLPKHGPGAVADALKGNGKYRSLVWTKRLDRAFPADHYLFSNAGEWLDRMDDVVYLKSSEEPPVKVVFVPKTQKTPRVIAIEPTWNQFCQQSLLRELVAGCEADKLLMQSIHFTDSTINGRLARESSVTRALATLDMSEASDRVHASLVHRLIRDFPHLTKAVFSCRSKCARLPTGETIRLKKFASMGSALCFPFEAFVFFTLAAVGLAKAQNLTINTRTLDLIARQVHVFGDDLIIPSMGVGQVIESLESVGLKVNRQKTFVTGSFRESCGVDAFKGHFVTPVYVRTEAPTTRHDANEIASYVATSNLFYKKGYWATAAFIRDRILGRIASFPHVREQSNLLGYASYLGTYSVERWNRELSRFETKGLTLKVRDMDDSLTEYRRLFKFFTERGVEPLTAKAMDRSTRRGSVYTKTRWNTPY